MLLAFYLFAVIAVIGALGVLIFQNPIYCAISLVITFFFLGGIYILINTEFVAIIQILVYAGAILVLFLFVIMLLNIAPTGEKIKITIPKTIAVFFSIGLLSQLIGLFNSPLEYGPKGVFTPEAIEAEGSIAVIGRLIYGEYVLPFEIISILLLVAVIGAVILAKRHLN